MIWTLGFFSFRYLPTPLMVPPVPMPQTKWVILPSVVFPNFRAGGLVVGFGVRGIVVLVRIVGVGNFARQFFGDAVIAARIFGLDGGGANDHFGAEGLQQIHFFLGLLVGGGEDALVAADGGDQRQAHAGVAASAFDDGAAGLEQAFLFGIVNHGDADAVFHGAAGIQHFGFHPDLRLEVLQRCG